MIRDRIKEAQARKLAGHLVDSEAVEGLCNVIATVERAQLEAVQDLHDAVDVEMIDSLPDVDDRRDELQSLIAAMMGGDLEEQIPDLVDAPADEIEPYVAMDADEWDDQIEEWARTYRERAPGELDQSDRDLADQHVRTKWGLDLATFERLIVNFDAAETAEFVFTGNLKAVERGIERATEEVSDVDEGAADGD